MQKKFKDAREITQARIDISVVRNGWVTHKGNRIDYYLIRKHLGSREDLIKFLVKHNEGHSPNGFYGGPITKAESVNVIRLLKLGGLRNLDYSARFFVSICGSIAPDVNPDPKTRTNDWNRVQGFDTRKLANVAARKRYDYYFAWCRGAKGKRTNVVTLKLYDKTGTLIEEKSN